MWKDIIMWVLGVGVTIVLGLLGFFGKSITDLLKGMLAELRKITGITIQHEERIKTLEEAKKDHELRIRDLENF